MCPGRHRSFFFNSKTNKIHKFENIQLLRFVRAVGVRGIPMCLPVFESIVVSIRPFYWKHVEFHHCSLLSLHNCMDVVSCSPKPRPDLSETLLPNSDLVFYTDGSTYRENGVPHAGYAIWDNFSITESAALPPSSSAQIAELYALMRACHLTKGKTVTMYTDSRYAFGCLYDFGTLWANWGFIASSETPVKHGKLIGELLDVCQLSSSVAVVKCVAHTRSNDPISLLCCNALADHAVKAAAEIGVPVHVKLCPSTPANDLAFPNDMAFLQETADVKEHRLWLSHGCKYVNNLWVHNDSHIVAPMSLYTWLARMSHGLPHVSKGGMSQIVLKDWYAPKVLWTMLNLSSTQPRKNSTDDNVDTHSTSCLPPTQQSSASASTVRRCLFHHAPEIGRIPPHSLGPLPHRRQRRRMLTGYLGRTSSPERQRRPRSPRRRLRAVGKTFSPVGQRRHQSHRRSHRTPTAVREKPEWIMQNKQGNL